MDRESPAFREMQEMKRREVEHVRWRCVKQDYVDPDIHCVEHALQSEVKQRLGTAAVDLRQLLDPTEKGSFR